MVSVLASIFFDGLVIGGVFSIIAVGLNLVFGTMRLLNIAHGDIAMLSSYMTFWLFTLYGVVPLVTLVISFGLFAAMGAALYAAIFHRLLSGARSNDSMESASLLIFFGFSVIFSSVAALEWTSNIRGYTYLTGSMEVFGATVSFNRLTSLSVSFASIAIAHLLVNRTWFGKALRALVQDRKAAQLMGINPGRIYMGASALGFGFAGVAGVIISMMFDFSPFIGLSYTLIAFIIVILGGIGSIKGSLVGGLILGYVQVVGTYFASVGVTATIAYTLFVLIMFVRPKGLFGRA